jgi:putative ABC transport system permease protein
MTGFALQMAWRETRAAWRHFLYFFVCIALGVGALVGVALFSSNVERAVTREARGLMGGDLEIRLSRPMGGKGETVLRSLADRGISVLHVSELAGMAAVASGKPAYRTQIVELKAVEEGYPFYGNLQVEPPRPLMELLSPPASACLQPRTSNLEPGPFRHPSPVVRQAHHPEFNRGVTRHEPCHGAVVQQSLLIRLGLSVGDRFKVGETIFTITGVLRKEPDRVAGPFNLGPRVMVSREGLAAAELIKPGSRVRERYLVKLPPAMPVQPLLHELRGRLAGESARVTGYRDAQPQLKQFLDQLTRYLGLIGLTALFIGGIGVATTIHAFIREKLQTIAILKTVGAESGTVIGTYLLQALLLGTIGSAAGAALGAGLQYALPPLVTGLFGADLMAQLDFSGSFSLSSILPLLKGIALGILTTLLFTLWPLLGIRDVSPARIFRRDVQTLDAGRSWQQTIGLSDRVRLLAALGIAAGLAGLAVWQAGNWRIGLLFIGALAAAVTLLTLAARLLVRTLAAIPVPRSVAVRHAIGNLHRPGSQAIGVMVSVGIGVMVIVAVSLLERTLVDQVGESRPVDSPSFFFIDIQPDQKEALLRLLRERTHDPSPQTTPLVRSRLHAINGRPVAAAEETERPSDRQQDRRKNWYLTREYVLTFLQDLPKDNTVIKGEWWKPGQRFGKPLVSIEEDAARNLGLDLGSTVEFEIQGATVSAEVSSIRKVEWGNFSTNFYMIFSPGVLDGAPFTYVATVRVPPEQEVPLQQAVVAAFPNVTAINIGDVLDSFARILDRLALAIRAIAVFCILAGVLVMAAALAATRYRRLYESVVLKALGATRGLIAQSFAVEYALLGAAAGLIGTVLASLLSWAVLRFILEDVIWTLQPDVLASGFVLTVLLSLVVGFLSTFRILGQRPLAVLRHE